MVTPQASASPRQLPTPRALAAAVAAADADLPELSALEPLCLAHDLREGDFGPEVMDLQKAMLRFGHLADETLLTGYFGPATRAAVKEFQALHDVPPTGYWGSLSRTALCDHLAVLSSLQETVKKKPPKEHSGSSKGKARSMRDVPFRKRTKGWGLFTTSTNAGGEESIGATPVSKAQGRLSLVFLGATLVMIASALAWSLIQFVASLSRSGRSGDATDDGRVRDTQVRAKETASGDEVSGPQGRLAAQPPDDGRGAGKPGLVQWGVWTPSREADPDLDMQGQKDGVERSSESNSPQLIEQELPVVSTRAAWLPPRPSQGNGAARSGPLPGGAWNLWNEAPTRLSTESSRRWSFGRQQELKGGSFLSPCSSMRRGKRVWRKRIALDEEKGDLRKWMMLVAVEAWHLLMKPFKALWSLAWLAVSTSLATPASATGSTEFSRWELKGHELNQDHPRMELLASKVDKLQSVLQAFNKQRRLGHELQAAAVKQESHNVLLKSLRAKYMSSPVAQAAAVLIKEGLQGTG
eukprot:SM000044S15992  [mRNA]  locus=s44:468031:471031:+ [translate_table: standard]